LNYLSHGSGICCMATVWFSIFYDKTHLFTLLTASMINPNAAK
jgi:hypothetical protein